MDKDSWWINALVSLVLVVALVLSGCVNSSKFLSYSNSNQEQTETSVLVPGATDEVISTSTFPLLDFPLNESIEPVGEEAMAFSVYELAEPINTTSETETLQQTEIIPIEQLASTKTEAIVLPDQSNSSDAPTVDDLTEASPTPELEETSIAEPAEDNSIETNRLTSDLEDLSPPISAAVDGLSSELQ